MKKLLVMVLVMLMMVGLSAVGLALDPVVDTKEFKVNVAPYFDAGFNTPDGWAQLFGNGAWEVDEVGLYITNGNETATTVDTIWNDVLGLAPAGVTFPVTHMYESGFEGAESFYVAANTKVEVQLSADWDGWVNSPTLLAVHSDANWDGGTMWPDPDFNGIGSFGNFKAYIGNQVSAPNNANYAPMIAKHNEIGTTNDSFYLDFIKDYECSGPIDFTIDGALLIPKLSQTPAGEYSADVMITVSAAPEAPENNQ